MWMWAVVMVAEHAAIMYSASDVDMATGVGIVEFASIRAPLLKIKYPTVERSVSGHWCGRI